VTEPTTKPEQGQWLTQSEAAARLGWHLEKLKSAARRGRFQRRKGNRGEWLVLVPAELPTEPDHAGDQVDDHAATEALTELRDEVAELRERAGHAEGQVAAMSTAMSDLRQTLEHERAERAKLAAELAEARKPALVRLLEAFRRR
jgi:chromosome segregation ATPase